MFKLFLILVILLFAACSEEETKSDAGMDTFPVLEASVDLKVGDSEVGDTEVGDSEVGDSKVSDTTKMEDSHIID